MKKVGYECRSVKLLSPLGEVSGFADVLLDDDDDECLEPDSETRLRLYQAKYFLEDILINTQVKQLTGLQIAYLLDLTSNSLSKIATVLGLTKERISQIRNGNENALPKQHVKQFVQYILNCVLQELGAFINPWAHNIENYTPNDLKIGIRALKRNTWKSPSQSFSVPCNYNNERKLI